MNFKRIYNHEHKMAQSLFRILTAVNSLQLLMYLALHGTAAKPTCTTYVLVV